MVKQGEPIGHLLLHTVVMQATDVVRQCLL